MANYSYSLLHQLCKIAAPSGSEAPIKNFIIQYVNENSNSWRCKPEIIANDQLQDCLILKFGDPTTAVFAHMDSVGFMVRYQNQLIPIGQPEIHSGYKLVGHDTLGPVECDLSLDKNNHLFYHFGRGIDKGTPLVFKCNFRETDEYIQSCYLDNRLGIYSCLRLAESLQNGLLVFSCWEEVGGGSVPLLAKYLYEKYHVQQALIADITWITDGVMPGNGVAISIRDQNIPRRSFVNKIITLAEKSGINYQLEVEFEGSSDGREIQQSPYPIDWCFIGAAEQNVHSPDEKVHKDDIESMIGLYQYLLSHL